MEDLLNTIEKSCFITSESDLISKRKSQFKCNGRTYDSFREKRRTELLEDYKRKREELRNKKRGLLNDDFSYNEDWVDWQEAKNSQRRKWINHNCKDQLMLSEWLLDHPHDLDTNWTCVLCPKGRRALVVAKWGCTRAYHKNGFLLAKFKSILPNGAPSMNRSKNSDVIILDCIWKESTKQLFALDVLHWKSHPLFDSEAQFRLYWLKSKLSEVKQSVPPGTVGNGVYDVFLPYHCNLPNLPTALLDHDPSEVDGILFYHNNVPYVSGQTPLVGWLKPYMLPERFDLPVPQQYLALKPETYVNLEQWVSSFGHSHSRAPRKEHLPMETANSDDQSPDDSVVTTDSEIEDVDNKIED